MDANQAPFVPGLEESINDAPHCRELEGYHQKLEHFLLEKIFAGGDWEEIGNLLRDWKDSDVRPMLYSDILPLLCHKAVGGNADTAIPLAAHWMLGNLAARIFDDLQDQDKQNMPWSHWPIQKSLPVALGLLFAAQQSLTYLETDAETLKAIWTRWSATGMLASQGQQVVSQPNMHTYLQRIIANTASLFSTCCWAGARLGSDRPELLNALETYGHCLGVVIQITNDARGVSSDLRFGRLTLVPIYALSLLEHPRYLELAQYLDSTDLSDSDIQRVNRLLHAMGAYAHAYSVASVYERRALAALDVDGLSQADTVPLATYVTIFLGRNHEATEIS